MHYAKIKINNPIKKWAIACSPLVTLQAIENEASWGRYPPLAISKVNHKATDGTVTSYFLVEDGVNRKGSEAGSIQNS